MFSKETSLLSISEIIFKSLAYSSNDSKSKIQLKKTKNSEHNKTSKWQVDNTKIKLKLNSCV